MSVATSEPAAHSAPRPKRVRRARRASAPSAQGEPFLWLTGGALGLCVAMIVGLLGFVLWRGGATFWPRPVLLLETVDGQLVMGERTEIEIYEPVLDLLDEASATRAGAAMASGDGSATRELIRSGNFDLTSTHFRWVSDFDVVDRSEPEWALVLERLTWGRFYGFPKAFLVDGEVVASSSQQAWRLFEEHHDQARAWWQERRAIESRELGRVSHRLESARLDVRAVELEEGVDSEAQRAAAARLALVEAECALEFERLNAQIADLAENEGRYRILMETADGVELEHKLSEIVRAYPANRLSFWGKLGVYVDRWHEFLTDEPREANNEGGVFPAIFGTVVMTLLMSVLVVPFGVLAALYLREYAKQGFVTSTVRIAVNNLAGVPSIVFGVFGLGFFCYIVGANIDELLFAERLPSPTYGTGGIFWASLTLALLTLPVVIVATEEALSAVPNSMREGSYACGATKWQTIRRIVLPKAAPGIMTGTILAIARGAGEVAPLMLVGAVKVAPDLPVDGIFPFIHPERSFMHLGFHVYDLGFQSQNSEAAKPMVFTTTLLLIGIVILLNLLAIGVRARLRRRALGHV